MVVSCRRIGIYIYSGYIYIYREREREVVRERRAFGFNSKRELLPTCPLTNGIPDRIDLHKPMNFKLALLKYDWPLRTNLSLILTNL